MVSKCCRASVSVEGYTPHYYVCDKCGCPCELKASEAEVFEAVLEAQFVASLNKVEKKDTCIL